VFLDKHVSRKIFSRTESVSFRNGLFSLSTKFRYTRTNLRKRKTVAPFASRPNAPFPSQTSISKPLFFSEWPRRSVDGLFGNNFPGNAPFPTPLVVRRPFRRRSPNFYVLSAYEEFSNLSFPARQRFKSNRFIHYRVPFIV